MEIIDTHAQLWTEEAIRSMPAAMRDGYIRIFGDNLPTLQDTIADMDAAGVSRSVVVAVDAETRWDYRVSNELVAETVARHPDRLIGFASVDPNKGEAAGRELRRAVESDGMRGLKLLPHLVELRANDPVMYPLYEVALEVGVPVLFHMGTQFHTGTKLKYCRPIDVDEVAVDFPDLKLIIAHFGWPWYEEALAVSHRNVNVYFNIAGWAPKRIPRFVFEYMRGPVKQKALLGSDYPLVSRKRVVGELAEIDMPDDVREHLYSRNALEVIGGLK
ncbi:MAG: amidohydrolase family protein [Actinobacteria bacterium]|nr:amidohydrolase family protein [Actinomycetota bacterium]MBU1943808.1 amidohydrolase family protein [Actinomycetota bacterium]MBU2689031.1 amidohydrolase family protein [Actinomycetota bacterium]